MHKPENQHLKIKLGQFEGTASGRFAIVALVVVFLAIIFFWLA